MPYFIFVSSFISWTIWSYHYSWPNLSPAVSTLSINALSCAHFISLWVGHITSLSLAQPFFCLLNKMPYPICSFHPLSLWVGHITSLSLAQPFACIVYPLNKMPYPELISSSTTLSLPCPLTIPRPTFRLPFLPSQWNALSWAHFIIYHFELAISPHYPSPNLPPALSTFSIKCLILNSFHHLPLWVGHITSGSLSLTQILNCLVYLSI
jgi:hypothetical protein